MSETEMWNNIYASGGSGLTPTNWPYSFNELLRMSLELIEDIETPFVVDDGCGKGELVRRLAELRRDARVIGIDDSQVGINIAKQNASKRGLDNVRFHKGLIEIYLESKDFDNRDLSISVNAYQYFINEPGKPNDKALHMINQLSYNIRDCGYFLMVAPSLEFFGEELFPEFVDYTEPLPCYRARLPNGIIAHQETLFGKRFVEMIEERKIEVGMRLLDYGELPFNARDIFPIITLAERMSAPLDTLEQKVNHYVEIQKNDPSKGPTVDWYLFQKV